MRPSINIKAATAAIAALFASARQFAGRDFARTTAETAFGAVHPPRRTPEEIVGDLLRAHAPRHPGLHRQGNRAALRRARREFGRLFDRFKGTPTRNGHNDGKPAQLNRAARRSISRRLQFA